MIGAGPVVTDPKYLCTWVYTVAPDAAGLFTLSPVCHYTDSNPDCPTTLTFVVNGGGPIPGTTDALEVDVDCNANGTSDSEDVANCEGELWCLDCNENGVPDECDLDAGRSFDCNENSVPDECEVGEDQDCNENAIPDLCDLHSGSRDCNDNLIPDECDIAAGTSEDCNGNGLPDECGVSYGDVNDDGFSNMLDVLCAYNTFKGSGCQDCPDGTGCDVAPCGGDGFVNMLDVYAIASSFSGQPACPEPCP